MIVKRIKEFPGVFRGIGEAMSRHDERVDEPEPQWRTDP